MEQFTPKVKLLSAVQVSEWLGIPVATLSTLRSRPGRHPIPFIRSGKTIRYSEKEILKWIDANTYDRAACSDKIRTTIGGRMILHLLSRRCPHCAGAVKLSELPPEDLTSCINGRIPRPWLRRLKSWLRPFSEIWRAA